MRVRRGRSSAGRHATRSRRSREAELLCALPVAVGGTQSLDGCVRSACAGHVCCVCRVCVRALFVTSIPSREIDGRGKCVFVMSSFCFALIFLQTCVRVRGTGGGGGNAWGLHLPVS